MAAHGERSGTPIAMVPGEVAEMGGDADDQAVTLRHAPDSMERELADLTAAAWSGPAAAGLAHGCAECRDGGSQIFDTRPSRQESTAVGAASTANALRHLPLRRPGTTAEPVCRTRYSS